MNSRCTKEPVRSWQDEEGEGWIGGLWRRKPELLECSSNRWCDMREESSVKSWEVAGGWASMLSIETREGIFKCALECNYLIQCLSLSLKSNNCAFWLDCNSVVNACLVGKKPWVWIPTLPKTEGRGGREDWGRKLQAEQGGTHTFSLNIQEAEADRSLWVLD